MSQNGDIGLSSFTEGAKKAETTNEKAKLVEAPQLSAAEAERLRKGALIVAWISVILLLILGILTFVVGVKENSAASFAFAIGAFLDCLTSAVVVWRYMGNAYTVFSESRERTACIVLGIMFILSSLTIFIKSVVSLALVMPPGKDSTIWHVALINAIACTGLAVAKFIIGKKLSSKSLITDAFSSTVGALISYSILVNDLIYTQNSKVWWVDSVIGIICSTFLFIYGVKLLYDYYCKARWNASMDSSNNNS